MEVNRSLEAGVRMRVLVAGGRVGMGIEKRLIFDTPTHRQIPRLDLVPTDACMKAIQLAQSRGDDISKWYVVTDSLSAVVQKQECGSFDAKAGAFVLSGNTKDKQMCEQTSLEPVAVAYKRQPLISLIGRASSVSVMDTSTGTTQATVASRFDAVGASLGVQERLREQRCDAEAQQRSSQIREQRVAAAMTKAQAAADAALARMEGELVACRQLNRGERKTCIDALHDWIRQARQLVVTIPAGVERVETACGSRDAAFEGTERTLQADALPRAETLLSTLVDVDTAGCGEVASGMDLIGRVSMDTVDRRFRTDPDVVQCMASWAQRRDLRRWSMQLIVRFAVGANGRVQCAEVASEEHALIDDILKNCITDATYAMNFPVSGGAITLEYPLNFSGG